MDLHLFIGNEHPPDAHMGGKMAEHAEQLRLARQGGFDGVAIGNHLSYGDTAWFPPLETLLHLAPEAGDMQLATCMLILPLYHPFQIAEQAALLDAVSGGRFTLGVAPGWQRDEFELMGLDFTRRIGRYLEGVDLIRRLFTEEAVNFAGRHFTAEDLTLALRPVRRPRPPMWFGGSVDAAVERAGRLADTRLGDSWVASSHLVGDVVRRQAECFRETLEALGKPMPARFPMLRNIVVAPDRQTAVREAGPFLEASYRVFGQWGLFRTIGGVGKEEPDLDELLAGRVVMGSPEEVADELLSLAEATGCNRIVTRIQWLGMDQRLVLRSIDLLSERVLPMLRKETRGQA
ncbi:MAG: LLM class flavin-dependent oxidoreductase [Alphaproteobacteria bacterium]|nr:LLM class flavin-dependent oxidoreductase [Alphaproteobacteria bacterium]